MTTTATYIDPATGLEVNADLVARYGIDRARDEARLHDAAIAAGLFCPHHVYGGRFCPACEA